MSVTFLSPEAALIGLAVAVPVAGLALAESRARVARAVLQLPARLTSGSVNTIAIGAFAVLISIGAAQPVLERERKSTVRHDAEALFVIDTSKSMVAASGPGAEPRFDRARRMAKRMRSELADMPAGVGSLTDRVLLHLFPTTDRAAFELTLDRSLGIERPPSVQRRNLVGSNLEALAVVPKGRFFLEGAKRKLLVVFTDAETRPFGTEFLREAFRGSGISTILVRVGTDSEHVFEKGVVDPRYHPPPEAGEAARLFAEAVGGATFDEGEFGEAMAAARVDAKSAGPRTEIKEVTPTPLSSYVFAFAFIPLGFLLWRRNLR